MLKDQACGGTCMGTADVQVEVTKACGLSVEQLLSVDVQDRRLQQSGDYDFYYTITTSVVCATLGCANGQDITDANAIIDSIVDSLRLSIQSGSFASALASNSDVASVLQRAVLNCLVVWGTVPEPTIVSGLPPTNPTNTTTDNLYYPVSC